MSEEKKVVDLVPRENYPRTKPSMLGFSRMSGNFNLVK
jgi:hypothetical protein